MVVGRVLETLGSRVSIRLLVWPCVLRHRVTFITLCRSRITRNSDRLRASDRTIVAIKDFACQVSGIDWRRHHRKMKPQVRDYNLEQNLPSDREAHLLTVGWMSRQKSSRPPVEGEAFFLTSLFIEPPISNCDIRWNHDGPKTHVCGQEKSQTSGTRNQVLAGPTEVRFVGSVESRDSSE